MHNALYACDNARHDSKVVYQPPVMLCRAQIFSLLLQLTAVVALVFTTILTGYQLALLYELLIQLDRLTSSWPESQYRVHAVVERFRPFDDEVQSHRP